MRKKLARKWGQENRNRLRTFFCPHFSASLFLAPFCCNIDKKLAIGMNDQERMPLYREHRTLLRNGQWRRVVEELTASRMATVTEAALCA